MYDQMRTKKSTILIFKINSKIYDQQATRTCSKQHAPKPCKAKKLRVFLEKKLAYFYGKTNLIMIVHKARATVNINYFDENALQDVI